MLPVTTLSCNRQNHHLPAPVDELLVTLVTKLPLAMVGSGKPHIVRVVQGTVMVAEL